MSAIDISTLLTITESVYKAAKATSRSVAIGLLRQIEESRSQSRSIVQSEARHPQQQDFTCDHLVTYYGSMEEKADVFRALADPTRRAILDALFERDGQTAGGLWARFPEMTRFGVSKHLRILEEANLITTTRQGRTKLHFLNPVPIAQIAHRWISKYAAPYASALVDLESHVAGNRS